MRDSTIGLANDRTCRVLLALLFSFSAVTTVWGDHSLPRRQTKSNPLRSASAQQTDSDSKLHQFSVTLQPGQKLRKGKDVWPHAGANTQTTAPQASRAVAHTSRRSPQSARPLRHASPQPASTNKTRTRSQRATRPKTSEPVVHVAKPVAPTPASPPSHAAAVELEQTPEPPTVAQTSFVEIDPPVVVAEPPYVDDYAPVCEPCCDGGCDAGCECDGYVATCGDICCTPRCSVRAEYLGWWVNGFNVPPLLTTSPTGTERDDAGVLGSGATVVFGNQTVLADFRSGVRVTGNFWLNSHKPAGFQASYFGLAQQSSTFRFNSSQFPILARPFFNVEPGQAVQDSELIAFPGLLEGNAVIDTASTLQGVELLYRHAICCDCSVRLDCLAGFRYNQLDEELHFCDFKRVLDSEFGLPEGTTLEECDWSETTNSFCGAEVGVIAEMCHCICGMSWTLEMLGKIALGGNYSEVKIDGHALFEIPGGQPPVVVSPAGLLAQESNIGVYSSSGFGVIPELGITLGCDLTHQVRATVGYTFMYWSNLARPGDQFDTDLNLSQLESTGLVGEARPRPTGIRANLWAQGISLGLQASF